MRAFVSVFVSVVLSTGLLAVCGPVALGAHGAAHAAKTGQLSVVCLTKKGVARAPASGTCARKEKRVHVGVANRLAMCAIGSGVRALGVRPCARRGGKYVRVPTNSASWFCADRRRNGALRLVARPARCTARDRVLESRNHRPTALTVSNLVVPENVPAGTAVGSLAVKDPDADDRFTFRLVPGAGDVDNRWFAISGSTLATASTMDFERQASYQVRIATTDLLGLGLERAVTVTVVDQVENNAPTAVRLAPSSIEENLAAGSEVGRLSAADPDAGDGHVFALVPGTGGSDNAAFRVDGERLLARSSMDFETRSSYDVRLRATDTYGAVVETKLIVRVVDVREAPAGLVLSPASVAENLPVPTSVGRLSVGAGSAVTYALVAGSGDDDNDSFEVDDDELVATEAFDFEEQPSLSVRLRATDAAGLSVEVALVISVLNANESPTGISLTPSAVDEDAPIGATVGTLSTADPDSGDSATYTVLSDPDDVFAVAGDDLVTTSGLDFESATSHPVQIRSTDSGGKSVEQAFTVSVDNIDEAPEDITLESHHVAENQSSGTIVGNLTATDPEGEPVTWALDGSDGDNGSFAVSTDGELTTVAELDHEDQATYDVRVVATDPGGHDADRVVTVHVDDVNEAPVVVDDTYTDLIGNTTAITNATTDAEPAFERPAQHLNGALPLANDTDPEGGDLTVIPGGDWTTIGGFATIRTDGTFEYEPPAGVKNATDSFSYTVTDGTLSSTGTVTLEIGNRLIWYVGDRGQFIGTGTSTAPFLLYSDVNGVNDKDGPGDTIFMADDVWAGVANGNAGLTLEANQTLLGSGSGIPGVWPAYGTPTPLRGSVRLAEGSRVDGVAVNASNVADGLIATGIGSATVGPDARIGSTSTATGAAVSITGAASGDITIEAPITASASSGPLRVQNRTGGTVTFAGKVSTTSTSARAVSLSANTGATVRFAGGLDLSTGVTNSFQATGGGSLEITGNANALRTTTGTPLTVTDTTIGPAGLTFRSISSDGAANGIVLRNTGDKGAFTVTGTEGGQDATCGGPPSGSSHDAADCTGGLINSSTDAGVVLDRTHAPSLTRLRIVGSTNAGIRATDVTGGLSLRSSYLSSNGYATDENGVEVTNPGGAVTVVDSSVLASGNTGVQVTADSRDADVRVEANTIDGEGTGRVGVSVTARANPGRVRADVSGNQITDHGDTDIELAAIDALTGSVIEGRVSDNVLSSGGRDCTPSGAGIDARNLGAGLGAFAVEGNVVADCHLAGAIRVRAGDAPTNATVRDNQVTMHPGSSDETAYELVLGDNTGSPLTAFCADVQGNSAIDADGAAVVMNLALLSGDVSLPQVAITSPSTAQVQAALLAANPGLPRFDVSTGAADLRGGGTCAMPTLG